MKSHRIVRKYVISSAVVASVVFTPLATGSAFAHVNQDAVQKSAQQSNHQSLLQQGSSGQAVKSLQAQLKNAGYHISADGIFGPNTEKTVRDFQGDSKIGVDGVVGPETKGALSKGTSQSKTASQEVKAASIDAGQAKANDENPNVRSGSAKAASNVGVVQSAKSVEGKPYKWGGTTPQEGFDSSGLINYVFEQNGVNLHRTENAMWKKDGVRVHAPTVHDASVGDVVFFSDTYGNGGGATHSGIVIGGDKMVHAPSSGDHVKETKLGGDGNYWEDHYIGTKSFK